MKPFQIREDIYWTGVIDEKLETFDIIMKTPFGSTYNSYFIDDEKKVLIDTVKPNFKKEFLEKLATITDLQKIDYVIIQHTEPDHAGSLRYLLEINPNVEIFCTKAASNFLKEQVNGPFNCHVIQDGETLDIGKRKLTFITAPFLHWADTMFVYSEYDQTLFTCDCFGAHYAHVDSKAIEQKDYPEALKLYFDAIMKPFSQHFLNAYKKIKDLAIEAILPSHGPLLLESPQRSIEQYVEWAQAEVSHRNQKQVAILYLSAYTNTALMAKRIQEGLTSVGIEALLVDAETEDLGKIHELIHTSKGILLGSPTINRTMVKPMWDVLSLIDPMANTGKVAGVFGSYGWSGEGIQMAQGILKQMSFKMPLEPLSKKFSPDEETLTKCFDFGVEFAKHL